MSAPKHLFFEDVRERALAGESFFLAGEVDGRPVFTDDHHAVCGWGDACEHGRPVAGGKYPYVGKAKGPNEYTEKARKLIGEGKIADYGDALMREAGRAGYVWNARTSAFEPPAP